MCSRSAAPFAPVARSPRSPLVCCRVASCVLLSASFRGTPCRAFTCRAFMYRAFAFAMSICWSHQCRDASPSLEFFISALTLSVDSRHGFIGPSFDTPRNVSYAQRPLTYYEPSLGFVAKAACTHHGPGLDSAAKPDRTHRGPGVNSAAEAGHTHHGPRRDTTPKGDHQVYHTWVCNTRLPGYRAAVVLIGGEGVLDSCPFQHA